MGRDAATAADLRREIRAEPAATLLKGEAALDFIYTTPTSSETPTIQLVAPYLTHPDQEVRFAAKEHILQQGSASGADALQLAATKVADVEEATELRKAAEFLALPSWSNKHTQPSEDPESPKRPSP